MLTQKKWLHDPTWGGIVTLGQSNFKLDFFLFHIAGIVMCCCMGCGVLALIPTLDVNSTHLCWILKF